MVIDGHSLWSAKMDDICLSLSLPSGNFSFDDVVERGIEDKGKATSPSALGIGIGKSNPARPTGIGT